jgi:5-methylcytosine-specific restriction endonuclease McrA
MDTETYIYASMSWKKVIRKNCGNKCVVCGVNGQDIKLHAHHLIFKSTEPALALTESNGIMLCVPHHKELHKLNPIKQKRRYL